MHDIKTNFDNILEVLKSILEKEVDSKGNFRKVGKKPKFSDLELISLTLTSEYLLSIDSLNILFKKLKSQYQNESPNPLDRSQYYRCKKTLFEHIELLRKQLCDCFSAGQDVFYSIPLEICLNARALP